MSNLSFNVSENAYAVIDRQNRVIEIMDTFNDALEMAMFYDASCIETLENYDGYEGDVVNEFWISDLDKTSFLKQKIYVLIMILISAATVPICNGDATFAVFMIPLMVYVFFSKEYWLND